MRTKAFTILFLLSLPVTASFQAQPPVVQGGFTIQIYSVSSEPEAKAITQQLQTRGVAAYWLRSEVPGQGVRYRVRVGQFKTRAEAKAQGERWRWQGLVKEFFVDRYLPPGNYSFRAEKDILSVSKPSAKNAPNAPASASNISDDNRSLPPLIPGEWQVVDKATAETLLDILFKEMPVIWQGTLSQINQFRRLSLPFYPGAYLYEGLLGSVGGAAVFTFVVLPDKTIKLLDGRSDQIHQLNASFPISLFTSSQAKSYLKFFCSNLVSMDSSFRIVERIEDVYWAKQASAFDRQKIVGHIQPLSLSKAAEGIWKANGTTQFGTGIFTVKFEIMPDGKVEMLEDKLIVSDLPLRRETFTKYFRYDDSSADIVQKSLSNLKTAADRIFAEAEALSNQKTVEGNKSAMEKYASAAKLYHDEDNKALEASSLMRAGVLSSNLGQSLRFYEEALSLQQTMGDRWGEAMTLTSLGNIYMSSGEKQKAMESYGLALALQHMVGDRRGEAKTLTSLGKIYDFLWDMHKVMECYEQALPLFRAVGDRIGEANVLIDLGITYAILGKEQRALEYFGQALPLYRAVGNRGGEAKALTCVGNVYFELGENQRALEYHEQALPLYRAVGDRGGEAGIHCNVGNVYYKLGEKRRALGHYEQALPLFRAVGNRVGEADVLLNLGNVCRELGEQQKSLKYSEQALLLGRAVGYRLGEARAHSNLMYTWKHQQQLRLAIYFGKRSVNRYQELRAAISGLDKELQRSFLKSKEYTYRELADLLIVLGRLPEAQQVLDLLKEEEYFSYVRRDSNEAAGLAGRAALTPTEARLEKEFAEIADIVPALGRELEELNRLTQPQPAQLARRTELDRQLGLATERFQAWFGRLEKELGNTKESGERLSQIQTSEGFQDTLRELGAGTVVLYTVVGEQKYSVILTSGSGPQVAAEYNISREDLNKKIFALKDALRNPKLDPRPLAAELYNILLEPMEKNLEGAKAETLMFSLDGALRYLPMAALYDAKRGQYLIERYRVVIYTPAGASDLKNPARASWRGLGFGVSKEVKNAEVGSFSALRGVPQELRGVIRSGQNSGGVMEGEVYLDEQFTEQRFNDALRPRQFPLIHIASHFSFRPGDSLKSFLLLGDGKPLTIEKLRNIPNLFSGVDLLALSACETGVGEKDAEGKEVEGFGVLAQRKGAKAVLATLWPVADESTAKLMQEFYRLRETQKGMNKAEALRQAQWSLLRGGLNGGKAGEKRAEIASAAAQTQGTFKLDPDAPYAHPYYWAPFILIGNWR
jgi:CHAT domain-containing protein